MPQAQVERNLRRQQTVRLATSAWLKHSSEREHACAILHKRMFEKLFKIGDLLVHSPHARECSRFTLVQRGRLPPATSQALARAQQPVVALFKNVSFKRWPKKDEPATSVLTRL